MCIIPETTQPLLSAQSLMVRIFTRWCALATLHTLVAAAPPPIPALGWSVDELDAIMRKEGTDKSSIGHAYVNAYGPLLGPWRDQVRTLLEIGIGTLNPKQDLNMGHWSNGKHGRGRISARCLIALVGAILPQRQGHWGGHRPW